MSTKLSILIFQIVRYLAALGAFVVAAMVLWAWGRMVVDAADRKALLGIGEALLFGIFFPIPFVALCGWLGWRLWARWNANTVRWIVGAVIAMCIAFVLGFIDDSTGSTSSRPGPSLVFGVLLVPLLIVGAIVFRRASHWAIERAGLLEANDIYDQPPGHQARVKSFAIILSLCIVSAGGAIIPRLDIDRSDDRPLELLLMVSPLLAALFVYRFTIWIMRPRTRAAMASSGGFEVVQQSGDHPRGHEAQAQPR